MNELINDEAVYRTAPATPGLLKMHWNKKKKKIQSLKLHRSPVHNLEEEEKMYNLEQEYSTSPGKMK